MIRARGWLWAAQLAVTAAVAALVAGSLARNWTEFRALHVTLAVRPALLAAAVLTVGATYAVQIEAWRRILAGWRQRIGFATAARTWSLANLGRYLPGKVWSVAGLVVLARRAGVDTAPAAASAFVAQAVTLGAGAAVAAAVTPHATSPWRLAGAALAALGTVAALSWAPTARRLGRLAGATTPLEPLPVLAVLASAALAAVAWLGYGAAFWLLARGLVAGVSLPLTTATGIFAVGYMLGWLALFAPGGVGVRELVFIGLLAPSLGGGGALALSVASRLLLTALEAAAALLTLPIRHRPQEAPRASS